MALTGARLRLAWLPPFVLGAVGGVAAELAAGLLLYSTDGFARALSVVLATEAGAFALGLWGARLERSLEALRRRWLLCLVAFTAAAGFSVVWGATGGLAAASLSQGLGLGLLGGLPLYGVGVVLGSLEPLDDDRERPSRWTPGAVAAAGAAVGLPAGGLVLIPNFHPTSTFLLSVVLLSGAAVVHAWVLDGRLLRAVGAESPSPIGPLRLEKRSRGSPEVRGRVLLVGGRPASGRGDDGEPALPWARGLRALLSARHTQGARIALIGTGLGELAGEGGGTPEGGEDVVAVEPVARIAALVADGTAGADDDQSDSGNGGEDSGTGGRAPGTPSPVTEPGGGGPAAEGAAAEVGEPEPASGPGRELPDPSGPPFDAVVLALPLTTGLPTLEELPVVRLRSLLGRVADGGLLAVGGVDLSGPGGDDPLEALASELGAPPVGFAFYRPADAPVPLLAPGEGDGGGLLVVVPSPGPGWVPEVEGMIRVTAREPEPDPEEAALPGGGMP